MCRRTETELKRECAMPAKIIESIPGAYECDLASTPSGWVMAAVSMEDVDSRFVRNMDGDGEWEKAKALLRPDVTFEQWDEAFTSLRPVLSLVESSGGRLETVYSVSAEQLSGLAVVGESDPAYVWTSLEDGLWSVNLYHRGETSVVESGRGVLQAPAITRDVGGGLWLAWVERGAGEDMITVQDSERSKRFDLGGRFPSLAATGHGVYVTYEKFGNRRSDIYYANITNGVLSEPIEVASGDPLNFLPGAVTDLDGTVLVVWTSSPAWGFDTRVDQLRTVRLVRIDPTTGRVVDGPGTGRGTIPIPVRAFSRAAGGGINMSPSNPRLIRHGSDLVCTFRMFQPDSGGKKSDEWLIDGRINRDLLLYGHREGWYTCITRWDGESWSSPERVSDAIGFSHHAYGLAPVNGDVVVASHAFNQHLLPPREHRVELTKVSGRLDPMHNGLDTIDRVSVHPTNPPFTAPELAGPDGHQLIFGDLHDHTSHSSCSPVLDGNPCDNVRLQRDVLQYRVICIADHQRICDSDYLQRLDLLEREDTPGYVPLYAIEWNRQLWQHINFYTYDKEIMKHLRQILLRDLDIHLMFNDIVEQFPDKVMANRHFHDYARMGGHGLVGDTHTYLYDPRIEWAMEALHSRGDMMATEEGMFGGPSKFPFPVNFIEWKGAKLGFIGGTDHHMRTLGACSTGLWVKDLTGESVFEALKNRRTYACAGGEVAMWVEANGIGMGEIGQSHRPVEVKVRVASNVPIDMVSLWVDGGWAEHRRVNAKSAEITFRDERSGPGEQYYFVRVQTHQPEDYPKGPIIGYSSPVYLTLT
jgi:hypothetical protein